MKRTLLTLLIVLGTAFGLSALHTSPALADARSEICGGIGAASGGSGCAPAAGQPTVESLAVTIVNILSWVVGVLAVIMIVYAGFRYVTSGGDAGKIGTAKNTLIYAIVGIVIVALAQTIVKFVLQKVTG